MRTHPVRTVILIILTLVQTVCAFGGMVAVGHMRQELEKNEARLGADLLVYPTAAVSRISAENILMQGTPVEVYRDRSMLSRMDSCEGIDAVSHQIFIKDTSAEGSDIWIAGFDPDTDFILTPWLKNGESVRIPDGSVLAGSKVKISEQNTVMLFKKEWTVGAHLEETGSEMDETVYVPMGTLRDMIDASVKAGIETYAAVDPEKCFSVALVRVNDKSKVAGVTDWINIYVRKVTAIRSEDTLTKAAADIQGTTRVLAVTAAGAWLILLLALGITQSMLVKERMKEIYVWHAIGASRRIVKRIMLTEAFWIHLFGSLTGILFTGILLCISGSRSAGPHLAGGYAAAAASVSLIITTAAGILSTYMSVSRAVRRSEGRMMLTV